MKNLKFKVYNPEHSAAIQKRLFELGYEWVLGNKISYIDKPYLYCHTSERITFGEDEHIFKKENNQLATLDDLYIDDREVLSIEEVEKRFNVKVKH